MASAPDPADTIRAALEVLSQDTMEAPVSTVLARSDGGEITFAVQDIAHGVDALLAGRQQDKERIERLEEAAREYVDAVSADDAAVERLIQENDADGTLGRVQALTAANCAAAFVALAAALAGEEDTPP